MAVITLGGVGDQPPTNPKFPSRRGADDYLSSDPAGPGVDMDQWLAWLQQNLQARQTPQPGPPPQPTYNPLQGQPAGYGPPPQPAYNPLAGGSANTGQPPVAPYATAMPWRGPIADRPAAPAATAPSRFVQIARPNIDMAGSLRRTGGGPMMMSALDLSNLFRRAS